MKLTCSNRSASGSHWNDQGRREPSQMWKVVTLVKKVKEELPPKRISWRDVFDCKRHYGVIHDFAFHAERAGYPYPRA